jgi:glycine/D-amino acid oxidase-like deaminating enzyme
VSGVVTEHGAIRAPVVLCAAGTWTTVFCRSLGISLPQINVRGTVVRTAPGENVLQGSLWEDTTGIRRRQDGGYTVANSAFLDHSITPSSFRHAFKFLPALRQEYTSLNLSIGRDFINEWRTPKRWSLDAVSPFEKMRVLNKAMESRCSITVRENEGAEPRSEPTGYRGYPEEPANRISDTCRDRNRRGLGGDCRIHAGRCSGHRRVGRNPRLSHRDGFHIATGLSGHGFGIGPGAGKATAGMLTGTDTGLDLSELRLSRFFDGSKIRLQ